MRRAILQHRHCEEQSDEAIQGHAGSLSLALDCFALLAMTGRSLRLKAIRSLAWLNKQYFHRMTYHQMIHRAFGRATVGWELRFHPSSSERIDLFLAIVAIL
jgi:hypothetical protein